MIDMKNTMKGPDDYGNDTLNMRDPHDQNGGGQYIWVG
jgi:hypothetical protein